VDEVIEYVGLIVIKSLSLFSKWIEVAFFLIIIYMTMKQMKKLPKYYVIEIEDIYGNEAAVDGLRINFTTFTAAKSYAQFYTNLYGQQYKFRIVGRNRLLNYSLH
jgi:hypothetical protein